MYAKQKRLGCKKGEKQQLSDYKLHSYVHLWLKALISAAKAKN